MRQLYFWYHSRIYLAQRIPGQTGQHECLLPRERGTDYVRSDKWIKRNEMKGLFHVNSMEQSFHLVFITILALNRPPNRQKLTFAASASFKIPSKTYFL